MPILEQSTSAPPVLATSREPVAPKERAKKASSVGDEALRDAIILVIAAWLVLFFLVFSLRSHNL